MLWPARCYAVLLRNEYWYFLTDTSGKFIGPIFKSLGFLTIEDGTDKLSRNVGKELPLLAA
jgi:hypothetical protein